MRADRKNSWQSGGKRLWESAPLRPITAGSQRIFDIISGAQKMY